MTGSSKAKRPSGDTGETLLAKRRKLEVATVVEREGLVTTSRHVLHQQAMGVDDGHATWTAKHKALDDKLKVRELLCAAQALSEGSLLPSEATDRTKLCQQADIIRRELAEREHTRKARANEKALGARGVKPMRLQAVHVKPNLRGHTVVADVIHDMEVRYVGNDVLAAAVYVTAAPNQVPLLCVTL